MRSDIITVTSKGIVLLVGAATTPADRRAPPKFKQRTTRTFKSKAPKPGQKGSHVFFFLLFPVNNQSLMGTWSSATWSDMELFSPLAVLP
uniref:3',5'-cyclic-GMP phosphodiesterase n=1 Tax=Cyclopterus lumpus TaxID=8103 RepID=A0A8C2WJX1_CYCLU